MFLNAIKFTKTGSIEFRIIKDGDYLLFSLKDTGIGIAEKKLQLIFEIFMQADVSSTRQFEGAGLGLSIARAYVEMLVGKIWVESELGKGSTFYFTIPYNCVKLEKEGIPDIVPLVKEEKSIKSLKILIAEDDEASELFISLFVKSFGEDLLCVKSGADAVETLRCNPDINLILMDIKMMGMNGLEATRQIRQFNKDVIIIAQTAYTLPEDRENALDAGCNDYITKPIQKEELLTMIKKYF